MTANPLTLFSDSLADVVAAAAPSVVQVHGRRRPASGLVYAEGVVLTTARALGAGDGPKVRMDDGRTLDADLAGWDPATGLAVLRVPDLGAPPATPASSRPRVGHLALAVARSWSNAITASAGLVSVIGGPLKTGRGRSIDEVIRTSAPMHDGFAGGALLDASGGLIGIATATAIRGLGVVIPAGIAWTTAATILGSGTPRRGFLGIGGQSVEVTDRQRAADGRHRGLLVVAVTPDSPADAAGVLVGDVMVAFDGEPVESPDDLLELLAGDRIGRTVTLQMLRGGTTAEVSAVVGERPVS
jgi:S1-C subfamily serine protease